MNNWKIFGIFMIYSIIINAITRIGSMVIDKICDEKVAYRNWKKVYITSILTWVVTIYLIHRKMLLYMFNRYSPIMGSKTKIRFINMLKMNFIKVE